MLIQFGITTSKYLKNALAKVNGMFTFAVPKNLTLP